MWKKGNEKEKERKTERRKSERKWRRIGKIRKISDLCWRNYLKLFSFVNRHWRQTRESFRLNAVSVDGERIASVNIDDGIRQQILPSHSMHDLAISFDRISWCTTSDASWYRDPHPFGETPIGEQKEKNTNKMKTNDRHWRNGTNNMSPRHWRRYWSRARWMKWYRSTRRAILPPPKMQSVDSRPVRSSFASSSVPHACTSLRVVNGNSIEDDWKIASAHAPYAALVHETVSLARFNRLEHIVSVRPFYTSSPYGASTLLCLQHTTTMIAISRNVCITCAPNWLSMKCVCAKSTTHRLRRLKRPYAEHCSRNKIQLEQCRLTVSTCFLIKLGQNRNPFIISQSVCERFLSAN